MSDSGDRPDLLREVQTRNLGRAVFTIGYGGRAPADFIGMLKTAGVRAVVDVRLRPDRASLGS